RQYKDSSNSMVTTLAYSSTGDFGAPTAVTDIAGMTTNYVVNTWNAVTQMTQSGGLLDESLPPGTISPQTSYAYNRNRSLVTITKPKANQVVYKYSLDSAEKGYARLKAFGNADSSGNAKEMIRYHYDGFGNVTEERVLDNLSSSSACNSSN